MSKLFKIATLLLLTALCAQLNAQTTADEQAVNALMEEGNAAFTARDADRLAAVFAENADFINPIGMVMHGREAVRQGHLAFFKMSPKPTERSSEVLERQVRFLAPDLALLTLRLKVTETTGGKADTQQMTYALLARRSGGKWLAELVTLTPAIDMMQQRGGQ